MRTPQPQHLLRGRRRRRRGLVRKPQHQLFRGRSSRWIPVAPSMTSSSCFAQIRRCSKPLPLRLTMLMSSCPLEAVSACPAAAGAGGAGIALAAAAAGEGDVGAARSAAAPGPVDTDVAMASEAGAACAAAAAAGEGDVAMALEVGAACPAAAAAGAGDAAMASEAVAACPAAAAAGAGDDAAPRWLEVRLVEVSPGVFVNERGEQCDAYFRLFISFTPTCELCVAPRNFVYFQSCLQEVRPPAQAARFEGRLVQGGQEHLVLGRQPGCAVDACKRCGAATNEQRAYRV